MIDKRIIQSKNIGIAQTRNQEIFLTIGGIISIILGLTFISFKL